MLWSSADLPDYQPTHYEPDPAPRAAKHTAVTRLADICQGLVHTAACATSTEGLADPAKVSAPDALRLYTNRLIFAQHAPAAKRFLLLAKPRGHAGLLAFFPALSSAGPMSQSLHGLMICFFQVLSVSFPERKHPLLLSPSILLI